MVAGIALAVVVVWTILLLAVCGLLEVAGRAYPVVEETPYDVVEECLDFAAHVLSLEEARARKVSRGSPAAEPSETSPVPTSPGTFPPGTGTGAR